MKVLLTFLHFSSPNLIENDHNCVFFNYNVWTQQHFESRLFWKNAEKLRIYALFIFSGCDSIFKPKSHNENFVKLHCNSLFYVKLHLNFIIKFSTQTWLKQSLDLKQLMRFRFTPKSHDSDTHFSSISLSLNVSSAESRRIHFCCI